MALKVHYKLSENECSRLYSDYQEGFRNLAFRYVRDIVVAEDIVADSYLTFLEKREELTSDDNIPAYIFSIVKNNCLNWLYKKKKCLEIEKNIHSSQLLAIQEHIRSSEIIDLQKLFSSEIEQIALNTLKTMPELTRTVFIDHRHHDKSYKEIAAKNRISTNRVDFEMRRALKILRIALVDFMCLMIVFNHVIP